MIKNDNNSLVFKVLGISIETFSIFYGLFLILWGIIISLISNSNSFTSYIPSILGFIILIFSFLAVKFNNKKKLFMHLVVIFGIIVFLGGLDFLRTVATGNLFDNFWVDISKLMMLITGLFFNYQCIRSFIFAKKIRESNNI